MTNESTAVAQLDLKAMKNRILSCAEKLLQVAESISLSRSYHVQLKKVNVLCVFFILYSLTSLLEPVLVDLIPQIPVGSLIIG